MKEEAFDVAVRENVLLEALANRILELKQSYQRNALVEFLKYKWLVGKEISVTRVLQDEMSLRQLHQKTGIHWMELHRCIQFYEKYPNSDYELMAWREIIRQLPNRTKEFSALPEGVFDVIYADPPWQYDFSLSDRGDPEVHYETMTTQEICALKIPAAENAILFLWATNPKLPEALEVMAAWGFKYRSNMVWIKQHFGTGYYIRGQHELLLIGKKAEMDVPAEEDRPSSVITADKREHSRKPDEVYALIEKMYPNRHYLELFARGTREGWTSWGNEIGKL